MLTTLEGKSVSKTVFNSLWFDVKLLSAHFFMLHFLQCRGSFLTVITVKFSYSTDSKQAQNQCEMPLQKVCDGKED